MTSDSGNAREINGADARTYSHRRRRAGAHAHSSLAIEAHLDRRTAFDGLVDHAVSLGELEQLVQFLLGSVGIDVEAQANVGEPDRRVLGDAECAAEIE